MATTNDISHLDSLGWSSPVDIPSMYTEIPEHSHQIALLAVVGRTPCSTAYIYHDSRL
jgi:hypothetical protein